ncbi:MAG: hypothetical protein J6V07_03790, partial [Clostridia bacterium]|nr:hypothetical protein [Clostridia bacterium]
MSEFENERGNAPSEEETPAGAPGIRDISPEYVSDLLLRLRETMAVIREEEEANTVAEPEDDLPPWEEPPVAEEIPTAEETPVAE